MDIKSAMMKFYKTEGKDHILVSPFAKTELGKILSLNWRKKFFIPQLGEFISPEAFVAWLFTGNEEERWNTRARIPTVRKDQVPLLKKALFFAKYHQLSALKPVLIRLLNQPLENGKTVGELPCVEYKIHTSGVKEFHPDQRRVVILQAMVKHLIEKGPKEMFSTELFDYHDVRRGVMDQVKTVFNLTSSDKESSTEDSSVNEEPSKENTSDDEETSKEE